MGMAQDLYAQFTQAYRNLELFPLYKSEEIAKFREPYGQRTLVRLKSELLALGDAGKLIFTGHRGCGKSTLLAQLAQQMREANLFVAGYSIADTIEPSDVNHIQILYSIALKLLEKASAEQVAIPKETEDKLLNWFSQTKSSVYTDQIKQELSAGVNVFDFFAGKLQKESSFREIINQTYERRVSDLSQQIDIIASTIQAATGKPVLVIIDDLDKLDLAVVKSIFQDNIVALFSPRIRVVFTIPISVIRDPGLMSTLEARSHTTMLSVTKFFPREQAHQPDALPIDSNVKRLERILEKRIPDDLIEPEIKRQIVLLSGGVLREMVRLGQECCRECMLSMELEPDDAAVRINKEILTAAVKSLRNQFARPLGSDAYELLVKTYREFTPPDAKSDEFLELLHGLYVLEYENDDLWFDLHPMVADLLRRKQLIA